MSALHRDRRGAAMVEFIVILVPLMTLFLSMLELSRLAIAHLLLERAAGMAVRACAVMKDQPAHCEASEGEADALIQRAAAEGLRPWHETNLVIDSVECRTKKPSDEDTVQLQARFVCAVPIARNIVCSGSRQPNVPNAPTRSTRAVSATARYAHQGARYECLDANLDGAAPGATGPLDLATLGGAWP